MANKQFNLYYEQIRSKQKRDALLWTGLFVLLYLSSGYYAEFSLSKLLTGIPTFFDYLAQTIPKLSWQVLFEGRNEQGKLVEGSFAYWGYKLPKQLFLVWETFCVALAATVIAAIIASFLAFFAANNTHSPVWIRWAVRSYVAFLRTMPEVAWAVMFLMAYGNGPLPGFIALTLHSIGSLTKLFYENVEASSLEPVRGLRACGANRWQYVRFGLWPQVKPIFMSYSFLRLEVNFRSSTVLGQELMYNIKSNLYDQVSMTLILIIIVVSILDTLSGHLRSKVLGKM